MLRWRSRPVLLASALLVLVAVLAALQYRWLTEVSEAERERVRAHLQQCADDLQREFDREVTRAFVAFQMASPRFDEAPDRALAAAWQRWESAAPAPSIVNGVYVARVADNKLGALQRFDPASGALTSVDWPESLAAWRDRAMTTAEKLPGARILPLDPIEASIPAVVVSIPRVSTAIDGQKQAVMSEISGPSAVVVLTFDPARVSSDLVRPLVARFFGRDAAADYLMSIASRDGSSVVYTTNGDGTAVPRALADTAVSLFDVRPDDLRQMQSNVQHGNEHFAITIVRRSDVIGPARALIPGVPGGGAWELRIRHREGSLEELVAKSRRRNLAVAGAILLVLSVGIVMIVAYTDQRQRLAQQQIEFVAAVSHELRTPLAVIRSAADNLADGVVSAPLQVQRYGTLVATEGRRLSDMVERVLAYAGIAAHRRQPAARTPIDVASLVREAVDATRHDGEARRVAVHVEAPSSLFVEGDAVALQSAVVNVVGNAVKYSPPDGDVRVKVAAVDRRVQIVVADHGLGIDASDLPYVWRPFYRGRRALDAQTRGTGIGLSIVRHAVEEHGGRVSIASEPDAGTTVTIELTAIDAPAVATAPERASA